MKLNSIVDEIIGLLKADDFFSDYKITKAYPCDIKPTRLSKIVVAVGLNQIDASSYSLDSNVRNGEVSVFADIFVPFQMGAEVICDAFSQICSDLYGYNIVSISANRPEINSMTQCYILKSSITFSDEIFFGGDVNG